MTFLFSHVGGLLKPLTPKGTLSPSDDLNNIAPGYYNYYEEAGFPANFPGGSRARGYCIVFPNVNGNQAQMIFEWGYGRVLARICNSVTDWNGWITLNND